MIIEGKTVKIWVANLSGLINLDKLLRLEIAAALTSAYESFNNEAIFETKLVSVIYFPNALEIYAKLFATPNLTFHDLS